MLSGPFVSFSIFVCYGWYTSFLVMLGSRKLFLVDKVHDSAQYKIVEMMNWS